MKKHQQHGANQTGANQTRPAHSRPLFANPLSRYIRLFKGEFGSVAVFSLVSNLLMLAPTLYMLQLYDRVLISKNELTLYAITLITCLLFVVMAFSEWMRSIIVIKAGVRFDQLLSNKVFSLGFAHALSSESRKSTEAMQDLTYIRQFMTGNGLFAFFDMPWTLLYIAVLFILNPLLGAIAIVFCLIQLGLGIWNQRSSEQALHQVGDASRANQRFLDSKVRNIETLHVMGMIPKLYQRWQAMQLHWNHLDSHAIGIQTRNQLINKFVRYTMQSLILATAALLAIQGKISIGAMIASNVLIARALQPFDIIVGTWKQFTQAQQSVQRLDQLLSAEQVISGKYRPKQDRYEQDRYEQDRYEQAGYEQTGFEQSGTYALPDTAQLTNTAQSASTAQPATTARISTTEGDKDGQHGHMVLSGVNVHLGNNDTPVLNDINLHITPGQILTVMGPSGSGKTTLTRCLAGICPWQSGEILLNGSNAQHLSPADWAASIGYLPQDVALIEGSIADNIARFSEPSATDVIAAAQAAGIHDSILRLPQGYDTQLSESALVLSGGQRQLVGLARAIYQQPALLLLDEPNSHLDEHGEASLVNILLSLKQQGKSIVLVSHRSSILKITDQLLILKNGEIAHYGPRDLVMAEMNQARQSMAA